MKHEEAADLVEAILASLRKNPAQFQIHYNVMAAGAVGIGGPGGHGIVGIANGPGIGVYASAPTNINMQQVESAANAEMNRQFQAIQVQIQGIIDDLRSHSESSAKRDGLLAQLKTSWLPNVVVTTVAAILERVMRS